MDIRSLNKILKKEAIDHGLCAKWQRDWKEGCDRNGLIAKYKEGIDFCIANEYPANDFIKKNFTREMLRENNVLVDDEYSMLNARVCVLQGASKSNLRYNGWNAGTLYVRHTSKAIITARQMSFVIVHLFNDAKVECQTYDKASIVVLVHSKTAKVTNCIGNVKIKDELDYLSIFH